MRDLEVLATTVDEIARVNAKWSKPLECKIWVKITGSRCLLSEDVEEKHYARFGGSSNYS